MMKFLHITDTHLVEPGKMLKGLDPQNRFNACVNDIILHHSDAECCVITGDLADQGEPSAYEFLAQELEHFDLPCHVLMGNHDHRQSVLSFFSKTGVDENGFVQYEIKTSAGIFLILDTVQSGMDGGVYCELRQKWLKKKFQEHSDSPIFLFMHHPPFDLHLPSIDRIGFADKEPFTDIVKNSNPSIRHIFFGHAHRPLSGHWMGISFSSLRGTNHQVRLDFKSEQIGFVDEPPEYSVVFISEDRLVVHSHSYPLTGKE